MFSKTTEYALRASVYLGESAGEFRTAHHVAEATGSPPRYVSRVLQLLAEAGVAVSQRGPTGGFALARDPSEVTLLQVVSAVEHVECNDKCPLGLTEHTDRRCRLHRVMSDVGSSVRHILGDSTLADILNDEVSSMGLTRSANNGSPCDRRS